MSIFRITFRANKLHAIGRPSLCPIKEIEAPDSIQAINSLYHEYEHIKVINVEKIDDYTDRELRS